MPSQWLRRPYRVSAEPPPASTDVLNALPPRDEHASPWNAMPTTLSTMPSTTCLSLATRDHSPQLSVRFSQATLDQSSHQPAASTSPIQSPSPSPSPIPSPSSGVEYPGQIESAHQTGSQKPGDSPGRDSRRWSLTLRLIRASSVRRWSFESYDAGVPLAGVPQLLPPRESRPVRAAMAPMNGAEALPRCHTLRHQLTLLPTTAYYCLLPASHASQEARRLGGVATEDEGAQQ